MTELTPIERAVTNTTEDLLVNLPEGASEATLWQDIRKEVLRGLLLTTLAYTRHNHSLAARLIGINRATLRAWLDFCDLPTASSYQYPAKGE